MSENEPADEAPSEDSDQPIHSDSLINTWYILDTQGSAGRLEPLFEITCPKVRFFFACPIEK